MGADPAVVSTVDDFQNRADHTIGSKYEESDHNGGNNCDHRITDQFFSAKAM